MKTLARAASEHAWILDPSQRVTITEPEEPPIFADTMRAGPYHPSFVMDMRDALLATTVPIVEVPMEKNAEKAVARYLEATNQEYARENTVALNTAGWTDPQPSRSRRFFHRLMPSKVAL